MFIKKLALFRENSEFCLNFKRAFLKEMTESTISSEELIHAYQELQDRCMTQSATWVLEFLIEIDKNSEIKEKSENVQHAFAKTLFRNSEFKRAQDILQNDSSQKGMSIYFLSKILDAQRQLQQDIPEESTFIADLPVSTKHHCECYTEIVKEQEKHEKEFDAINLYLYAVSLSRASMYEKAVDVLVKSLNEFPLNSSAWKLMVNITVRFDSNVITTIVTKLPNHWTTDIFKVQLKSELQSEDAAASFAQLNLKRIPRVASIIALEAANHYHDRNFDKSAELFKELRTKYPLRLDTLELYSNLLFVKEDLASLSELAQNLEQIDKYRPETLTALGNFFSLSGRHEDAIEQFSRALRFDPSFNFAWTLIGHEYIELQNTPAATASYTKAYEVNPRDFRALYGLGRAFELGHMPFHAILFYRKAVTMNPSDSRLWMALGQCYEELDQIENAIKCYQRAVCNTDDEGTAIFKLGRLYRANEDPDRAAFCFGTFIDKREVDASSDDTERRENEREAISFLAHYFLSKRDKERADQYANMMLQDPSLAQEGKYLMKDINSL